MKFEIGFTQENKLQYYNSLEAKLKGKNFDAVVLLPDKKGPIGLDIST